MFKCDDFEFIGQSKEITEVHIGNTVIKEVTFSPFIGQICFVWSKLHTHQQLHGLTNRNWAYIDSFSLPK